MGRKPAARGPLDEARDAIAGRVRLDMHELFELIHAINPTGRQRDPAETERRYQLKAGLQSLLVRTCPGELRVTAEADGTIAIAHRYSGRDACHARLETLDDEARAWVRWQLDVGEDARPEARTTATAAAGARGGGVSGDPLERGRRALAEYDFDEAVAAFREALATSGGGVAAARALLEVLVEQLAQDEEALAVEGGLGAAARQDGEVRGLLGLAAARAGMVERARRWLVDARGGHAAEAWAVLVRGALEQGAFEEAERGLRELEMGAGAAHSAVPELRAALAGRRAEARKPDEEALQAAVAAGDEAVAEARARAILARWPDSAVAGRAIAAIEAKRRARAASAALEAAADALARGELVRAREHAARAGGLGADAGEVLRQIEEAEAAGRAARDAERVERVCGWLREDEVRGLREYAELEDELRARVRARVPAAQLEWLDGVTQAGRGKSAAIDAAVAAVLALRDASAAAEAGDHERALTLLDAHETVLGGLREARNLRGRAREAVASTRRQVAEGQLERAEAAWRAGDVVTAERALAELGGAVEPAMRGRVDQLGAAIRRRRDMAERDRRIDALLAEGQLVGAQRELEARIAVDDGGDEAAVAAARERLATVRAGLRESWNVRTTTLPSLDPQRLGAVLGSSAFHHAPDLWVTDDGRVVLAAVHECHVFIVVADLASDRALIHHVQTPASLGRHATLCVDGERLWVAGDAHVLQLDWRTGDIARWEPVRSLFAPGTLVESFVFVPRARAVWLETSLDREFTLRVIDLDDWRVLRTVNAGRYMVRVPGPDDAMAALGYEGGAVLYAGRGSTTGELLELSRMRVSALVRHPDADGFVAATSPVEDDDAGVSLVDLVRGRPQHAQTIPDSHPDQTLALVSSRGRGLVAVYQRAQQEAELTVVRVGPDGFATLHRVPAPLDVAFAHDATSTRVFIVWETEGVHIRELGETPPEFGAIRERERLPSVAPHFSCSPYQTSLFKGPEELARDRRWDELCMQLEALNLGDAAEPPVRAHYHHLLGLAHARSGRLARAREVWDAGRAFDDESEHYFACQLERCCELVAEMPDPASRSVVARLRRAIAAADDARARGDVQAAVSALRAHAVIRLRERQSLARLADAWLELPEAGGDAAWFEKAQALAQLLAVAGDHDRDMTIPGAWDDARVGAVVDRARAWLTREAAGRFVKCSIRGQTRG